jgi:NADH-quinone oxidoreductase subunit E
MDIPQDLLERIDRVVTHYPVSKRSAVLPVLHLLQEHFRWISSEAVTWTAAKLELPPIQVEEVVTFYPGFRQYAPGQKHIRVCRTLSCAMAGSYEVMDKICEATGIDRSHTSHHHPIAVSGDGKFSVEFAECLACCGAAPVCLVEDDLYERVKPDDVKTLLAKFN